MNQGDVFYEFRDAIPSSFVCPITHKIMVDPVIDPYGNSYERAAIEDWLNSGHTTDPVSRRPLRKSQLASNRALRDSIEEYTASFNGAELPTNVFQPSRIPFSAVQHALAISALSEAQQAQINEVYKDRTIPEHDRMRIAVARCRWVGDSMFRLRVYGEFAQYLNPRAEFHNVGKLDESVKKDAADAYLWVLTKHPEINIKIDIINKAIEHFSELYPRPANIYDGQIAFERGARHR